MKHLLRLIEDVLPPACAPVYLPATNRAIFVHAGEVSVEFATGAQHQPGNSAWLGSDEIALTTTEAGATLWRWELLGAAEHGGDGLIAAAPGASSTCKLAEPVELAGGFSWLMRLDRVAFPPGGIAYTHVHQGPGIRCCRRGEIRIEVHGRTSTYGPGEAWLERGFEPVLAPTTEREETEFIRCFVLPRSCRGRSSIRYVLAEDAAKPKRQSYHVFGERFIELG